MNDKIKQIAQSALTGIKALRNDLYQEYYNEYYSAVTVPAIKDVEKAKNAAITLAESKYSELVAQAKAELDSVKEKAQRSAVEKIAELKKECEAMANAKVDEQFGELFNKTLAELV